MVNQDAAKRPAGSPTWIGTKGVQLLAVKLTVARSARGSALPKTRVGLLNRVACFVASIHLTRDYVES